MPDLIAQLADLGAAARPALGAPVLMWSAVALAVEFGARLARPSASVGLWARGATLALLPALIACPPLLAPLVPSWTETNLASAPETAGVAVGALPVAAAVEAAGLDVALGVLTLLAAVVSVLALGAMAGGVAWLARTRRSLPLADASVQIASRGLGARLGLRSTVDVVEVGTGSAPFTVGWRRPVIAVPDGLGGEALELALAHEMAHVRRAHFGWHLAEQVVCAAFAWHPLVHVLARGLALDRERAADADVLRLWPDRAAGYGRLLAAVSTRSAPRLALGVSSSTLIYRLTAMTHLRPDRARLARCVGVALFAIPLFLATASVPDAQPPPPPPPAADVNEGIESVSVWKDGATARIEVTMRAGTSLQEATAVADRISDGEARGEVVVIASTGERILRSTLNADMLPPPPPPPPLAPGEPPPTPGAPPPPPPPIGSDRLGNSLETDLERAADQLRAVARAVTPVDSSEADLERTAAQLRSQLRAMSLAFGPVESEADLDRTVALLRDQLLAVTAELRAIDFSEPEASATRVQLDARYEVILARYRNAVASQERRRLDRLMSEAAQ